MIHAQTLTHQQAKRMVKVLRMVAKAWYTTPYSHIFYSGICYAVSVVDTKNNLQECPYYDLLSEYRLVHEILLLCHGPCPGYLPDGGRFGDDYRSWKSGARAIMCLFMAEWLETEVLQGCH